MALIPLDIPAGFYRNGTEIEQAGRWRDGSLVRWRDNSLRPIGGWRERKASFSTNPVRGMHTWETNNGNAWMAGGSHSELKVMTGAGVVTDITPSDLAAGREDAAVNTGFGGGFYGVGYYGQPIQANSSSVPLEATTWSLDNWGEYLLAVHYDDGRLLEWQLDTASDAAVVSNAPTDNLAMVVTEERFVFCLGAGGNPRKVQWCDFEDNTVWTPSTTNQAGSHELQTSGQIMLGIRTRGQTLILTDIDAHAARYSGPPYIYNFQRVGTSCGVISRKAASDVDMGVFWMGKSGFFRFDGNSVSELGCDVHDYIFSDINSGQVSKIWSFANSKHGEIWWFYCSSNSNEIDRYVAFDYKENHWLIGDLSRTSGVPGSVFLHPIMAGHNADTDMYDHEVGVNYGGSTVFAETGPMSVGNGDNITKITKLLPDEKTQGDVSVTFKTRFYPNEADATHGPFTPANPTSVRFSGRQFRMRVEGERLADWRVGTMRVDAVAGGTR
jgi:hypothetical protein